MTEETGKSVGELKELMSKGAIGVEMVEKALEKATGQGGIFFKGMEKGSQTMQGQLATLSDNWAEFTGKIMQGMGNKTKSLIPVALEAIEELSAAFEQGGLDGLLNAGFRVFDKMFDTLGEDIKGGARKLGDILGKVLTHVSKNIGNILDVGIDIAMGLVDAVANALPKMLPKLVEGLAVLFGKLVMETPVIVGKLVEGIVKSIGSTFVMVTRRMKGISAETDAEIEALQSRYEGLIENIKEGDKNFKNTLDSILDKGTVVNDILNRMRELQGKKTLSNDEKSEMQSLVTQIKQIEGIEFNWDVNVDTGKLEAPKADLANMVKEFENTKNKYIDLLNTLKGKKGRAVEENTQLKEAIQWINDFMGQETLKWDDSNNTFSVINGNVASLTSNLEAYSKELQGWLDTYNTLTEKAKSGTLTEEEQKELDDVTAKLEEHAKKIEQLNGLKKESFDDYASSVENATRKMMEHALVEAGQARQTELAKEALTYKEQKNDLVRKINRNNEVIEEAEGIETFRQSIMDMLINQSSRETGGGEVSEQEKALLGKEIGSLRDSIDNLSFLNDEDKKSLKDTKDDNEFINNLGESIKTALINAKELNEGEDGYIEQLSRVDSLLKDVEDRQKLSRDTLNEELTALSNTTKSSGDEVQKLGTESGTVKAAFELLTSATNTLAGLFSNFELPSLSFGGLFSWLFPPKKNAKGGIFNQATFFPDSWNVVGEAGAEAVLPLNSFYDRLEKIAGNNSSGNNITIYQNFTQQAASPREIARQTRLALDRLEYGGSV